MSYRFFRRWVAAAGLVLAIGPALCLDGAGAQDRRENDTLPNLASLADRSSSAVVTIRSWDIRAEPRIVDPDGGFPDPPTMRELRGAGIIIDAAAGLIVTANHVVANSGTVEALLQGGHILKAIPLARSDQDDIALLKVAAVSLPALSLEEAGSVQVGEFVLAIGDPMDLGPSVTFGIVSALHRTCPGIGNADLIQSDALVDEGSSGGALVNMKGRVVGVIVARSGGKYRGFGFAVPMDAVRKLLASVQ